MSIEKDKGIAYCGLACCSCNEVPDCPGCRMDGCKDREACKNRNCCLEKGLQGCWECLEFPCTGNMLDNMRIRAFARYIREFGVADLMRCMERNERFGIQYHHAGTLVGDYDAFDTEEKIIWFIRTGWR